MKKSKTFTRTIRAKNCSNEPIYLVGGRKIDPDETFEWYDGITISRISPRNDVITYE